LLGALQKSTGPAENRPTNSLPMPANSLGESLAEFLGSAHQAARERGRSPSSGREPRGVPPPRPGAGIGADLLRRRQLVEMEDSTPLARPSPHLLPNRLQNRVQMFDGALLEVEGMHLSGQKVRLQGLVLIVGDVASELLGPSYGDLV